MSSLIDRHTVTVTYDKRRGEPRQRLTRDRSSDVAGDCVDCHQCVTVCPTGIDIRHGSQLECVACTACVDACNDVMRRVGRPGGLIRHTTLEAVEGGHHRWPTPRIWAYSAVWLVLVLTTLSIVATRPALDVVVLRQPGTLYATLADGTVANFYNVQIFNRSRHPQAFDITAVAPAGATVTPLGLSKRVEPHGLVEGRLLVGVPAAEAGSRVRTVSLDVRGPADTIHRIDSSFVSPGGDSSEVR
jgi:cytochrome c oxidase accessory protein FixG